MSNEYDEVSAVEEEHDPAFRIDGPGTANWALKKLAYYRKRKAANDQLYTDEVERLNEWRSDVNKSLEQSARYFEDILVNYHVEQLNEDEKLKTIKLPNGSLKSVAGQPKPVVMDVDAFLESAADDLVRVKREPDISAIKKQLKETGEVPTGVEIQPAERSYKVETN